MRALAVLELESEQVDPRLLQLGRFINRVPIFFGIECLISVCSLPVLTIFNRMILNRGLKFSLFRKNIIKEV